MTPIDYKKLLTQTLGEYGEILEVRQALDLQLAKKKQFIRATMHMLPDDEQEAFNTVFENFGGELGLTDAIRKVLQENPKKPLTATDVRDKLKQSKFDFSSYKTNPLASIHAVLKRLKPEEVEGTEIDGVAAWRWVGDLLPDVSDEVKAWFQSFENRKPFLQGLAENLGRDDDFKVRLLKISQHTLRDKMKTKLGN